jgi:hypothetical protein
MFLSDDHFGKVFYYDSTLKSKYIVGGKLALQYLKSKSSHETGSILVRFCIGS